MAATEPGETKSNKEGALVPELQGFELGNPAPNRILLMLAPRMKSLGVILDVFLSMEAGP